MATKTKAADSSGDDPRMVIMNTKEAAAYLHTTPGHLAQLRFNGCGPRFMKPRGRVLYTLHELNEWLARGDAVNGE